MLRVQFFAILCLSVLPKTVVGAPIYLIDGLPGTYKPGEGVTFDIRLPAINNLGSYNIDLVLESTSGTAGIDFYFDVAATMPASSEYVFSSSANFFDAANLDSPSRHRITLSDFDLSGVNIITDGNDRVATVVVQTASSFIGQLDLFVAAPSLILDTPDVVPTPVSAFEAIQMDIAAGDPLNLVAVPEPSSIAGTIAGLVIVLASPGRSPRKIGPRPCLRKNLHHNSA